MCFNNDQPIVTDRLTRSPLSNWRDVASVRHGQTPTDYGGPNGYWTSPELIPVVTHAEVVASHENVQNLLARHAIRSQDFTEQLEIVVVTPLALAIARKALKRFELSHAMIDAAGRIGIDEIQHAEHARVLIRRLTDYLGDKAPCEGQYAFIECIKTKQATNGRESELFTIASVIVAETLITKGLAKLAKDKTLDTGVSIFSQEHSQDESGHHEYFALLLKIVWPFLTEEEKVYFGGEVMPNAISMYLRLNRKYIYNDLLAVGFSSHQAERIIAETYNEIDIIKSKRDSARATLHHMKAAGMFEHPAVIAGLQKNQLM